MSLMVLLSEMLVESIVFAMGFCCVVKACVSMLDVDIYGSQNDRMTFVIDGDACLHRVTR